MTMNSWWLRKHPGLWAVRLHLQGQYALVKSFLLEARHHSGALDNRLANDFATQPHTAETLETAASQIQDPKQRRIALRAASYFYSNRVNNAAYFPKELLPGEEPAEMTIRYAKRAVELYAAGMEPKRRTTWLAELSQTHLAHLAWLHCTLAAIYLRFDAGDPTLALEETIREYTRALTILEPLSASEFKGYILAQLGITYLAYPTENPKEYAERAIETLERAHQILVIHAAKIRALVDISYSDSSLIIGMVKYVPRFLSLLWKPYWRGTPSTVLGVMLTPPSVLMKIHWGLATAYGALGDDAEAIRHYDLALEFVPLQSSHTEWCMLLLAKSAAYLDAADKAPWDEATVKLARQYALEVFENENWDKDVAFALGYPRLAQTLLTSPHVAELAPERERNLKNIADSLRDAVQTARRLDLQGAACNSLVLLSRAYEAQANWPRAYRAIVLAGRITKRSSNLARTPRLKLRLSREEGPILELGARAIFAYRHMLSEAGARIPQHLESHALTLAERARTRILQDELAQRALIPTGALPEDLQDFFKSRRSWLQADLLYVNLEISEAAQPPERMELVRGQRNASEARYIRELEAVRERFGDPNYDPDCPVAPVRASEIRALVRELSATEDAALVEFFLTDRNLVLFIVFPGRAPEDFVCLETSLTRNELNDVVRDWFEGLEMLKDGTVNVTQWETRYFSQNLLQLEGSLLAVRDAVATWETNTGRRISRLILVPHQFLHLLPLHACPLPDGNCWGSHTAIQYVPSASVLWQLHQTRERSKRTATSTATEHAKIVIAYSPQVSKSHESKQEPLYFARHEAEAVAKAIDATVITGGNATPTRVLAAIPHAPFIHFSCHASFEVDAPMKSSLTLAPTTTADECGENEQTGESGFLTLAQLLEHLHFSELPIVVLSACESGIPKVERYRDEYLGLPLAFLCAGAKTVVSTLWKTSDLAAWILMGTMTEHLAKGRDVLRALSLAQAEMQRLTRDDIRGRVERLAEDDPEARRRMNEEAEEISQGADGSYPLASPFWWAGFTVHGLADERIT
jgi:CHAT domain-containing protein